MIPRDEYLKELTSRSRASKIYSPHQALGVELASILGDKKHTAIYIRLAKTHDHQTLRSLALSTMEKKGIKFPGAYFMKCLALKKTENDKPSTNPSRRKSERQ